MYDPLVPYNELPPTTSLYVDASSGLARLAEDTRVAIELLRYAAKTLPDAGILLNSLTLQEARASSNVENIFTTNDDLYRGAAFEDFTEEAKEVNRYKDALMIGYGCLQEKNSISMTDLELINAPVNRKRKGIRSNLPNFNTLTQITHEKATGEKQIIYTPPHGLALLQEHLIDLLEYVYDDENYDVHPLIKISLAHFQFENIHPFKDGNGRTGRILNLLFLCQKGYLDTPILYASSYIIRHKNEYYTLLRTAKETQRYEEIVSFMLHSFKETAEHTLSIVEEIKSLLGQYTAMTFLNQLSGQRELLEKTINLVFRKIYVRISDVVDLGIHRQTAAVYLDQLVDAGLLSKEKVGRENIYKNVKLLELFEKDSEVTL
jgi:Fic family protein